MYIYVYIYLFIIVKSQYQKSRQCYFSATSFLVTYFQEKKNTKTKNSEFKKAFHVWISWSWLQSLLVCSEKESCKLMKKNDLNRKKYC